MQPHGSASIPSTTSFLAAYTTGAQLLWVREPTLPTNAEVTIGVDGSLYYLNILTFSLTDFDPGPAVDAMQSPLVDANCIITKYAP